MQGEGTAEVGLGGRSQWKVEEGGGDLGRVDTTDTQNRSEFILSVSLC